MLVQPYLKICGNAAMPRSGSITGYYSLQIVKTQRYIYIFECITLPIQVELHCLVIALKYNVIYVNLVNLAISYRMMAMSGLILIVNMTVHRAACATIVLLNYIHRPLFILETISNVYFQVSNIWTNFSSRNLNLSNKHFYCKKI